MQRIIIDLPSPRRPFRASLQLPFNRMCYSFYVIIVNCHFSIKPAALHDGTKKEDAIIRHPLTTLYIIFSIPTRCYPKNEMSTPAATAEPITPETLLAIQYCSI